MPSTAGIVVAFLATLLFAPVVVVPVVSVPGRIPGDGIAVRDPKCVGVFARVRLRVLQIPGNVDGQSLLVLSPVERVFAAQQMDRSPLTEDTESSESTSPGQSRLMA